MARKAAMSTNLLTISAAAARLGCSDNHIYRLIAVGELEAVDIALPSARRSKTRVKSDDIDAYIGGRTRRASSAGPGQPAA